MVILAKRRRWKIDCKTKSTPAVVARARSSADVNKIQDRNGRLHISLPHITAVYFSMDASGGVSQEEIMARIEAQVNAQLGEVVREQVTDKCFKVCADVSRKAMSSRETDCIDKCLHRFIDAMNVVTEALASRSNRMP